MLPKTVVSTIQLSGAAAALHSALLGLTCDKQGGCTRIWRDGAPVSPLAQRPGGRAPHRPWLDGTATDLKSTYPFCICPAHALQCPFWAAVAMIAGGGSRVHYGHRHMRAHPHARCRSTTITIKRGIPGGSCGCAASISLYQDKTWITAATVLFKHFKISHFQIQVSMMKHIPHRHNESFDVRGQFSSSTWNWPAVACTYTADDANGGHSMPKGTDPGRHWCIVYWYPRWYLAVEDGWTRMAQ